MNVKTLRKDVLKLNQQEFADALNMSKSAVEKWESGEKKPSGATLLFFQYLMLSEDARKFLLRGLK